MVGDDAMPVAGVDSCDARAYCKWAGKRLCGRVSPSSDGGESLGGAEIGDPVIDQWFIACTNHGTRRYSVGNTYAHGTCNMHGSDDGGARDAGTLPVGSLAACQGGYPGVYDLIGNVWEWFDDACPQRSDAGNAKDLCGFRGGSWESQDGVDCSYTQPVSRDFQAPDVGFRCCAP
jgi:formylglycine-generating enzyme required for sulfatase activity